MIELVRRKPWLLVVAALVTFVAVDIAFLVIASHNMPDLVAR